jgi:hypothetical protein
MQVELWAAVGRGSGYGAGSRVAEWTNQHYSTEYSILYWPARLLGEKSMQRDCHGRVLRLSPQEWSGSRRPLFQVVWSLGWAWPLQLRTSRLARLTTDSVVDYCDMLQMQTSLGEKDDLLPSKGTFPQPLGYASGQCCICTRSPTPICAVDSTPPSTPFVTIGENLGLWRLSKQRQPEAEKR